MHEAKAGTIKKIRHSLYQIHKCLLDHQSMLASIKLERPLTPYDLWQLSVDDSEFDWLKKISSLIIVMDEEMESSGELEEDIFDPIVHEIKSLFFSPMEKDIAFYERVSNVKETTPSLLLELGELMKLLIELVHVPGSEAKLSLSHSPTNWP